MQAQTLQAFNRLFGKSPSFLIRAPGRVNLIGEHTDYNEGFVMPLAIDRALWVALRKREDRQVIVHSQEMAETAGFNLDELQPGRPVWLEYIKGIAWTMQDEGYLLSGWEGVIAGDLPAGAGLSSSAALEIAVVRAFSAVAGLEMTPAEMALISHRADNEWVGINSGIMDQMISAAGQEDHALLIDCRSLQVEAIPLPEKTVVAVLDTNTRRGLVDSAYNERRQQCETAAAHFGVSALRDVGRETFLRDGQGLEETIYRRARHVITENGRVRQAKTAMQNNDAVALGWLLNASHRSLRDDYEVSSPALDTMVELAQNHPACYGARMTGAGFGGCALALLEADEYQVQDFLRRVGESYPVKTNLTPDLFICHAVDGASLHALSG